MAARLLFRDSQGRDGSVDLAADTPCYVGRALDCAIRTDDAMVSRKHSLVRMEAGRYLVEDLGSSNGTHVNEIRVTKQALNHNDVVRCGSLWLRFVDDTPRGDVAMPSPPRPNKKGRTQRLDPYEGRAGSPRAAALPEPQHSAGGYPSEPSYGNRSHQPTESAPLFGGPPAMPDGIISGEFSTPPSHDVPARLPSGTPRKERLADSSGERSSGEVERLRQKLEAAERARDDLRADFDREVADSKRLRAEIATHKERADELRRLLSERDEIFAAHQRVADELRDELQQSKDALATAKAQAAEHAELIAARDRQLARSQEEIGRLRSDIDDRGRKLAEVSRNEDERWKKLNDQLTEIDHLREVINQQERLLEERRVGLVGQEQVIKELRGSKEHSFQLVASMKAERDELKADHVRMQARLTAIDEDNRRLGELLAAARAGKPGESGDDGEMKKVTGELKQLRVSLRTVEAERDHLRELHTLAEAEHIKAKEQVARLEEELREAEGDRDRLKGGRGSLDDRLIELELQAKRALDDLKAANQARTEAVEASARAAREVDRLTRRLAEVEQAADERDATDGQTNPLAAAGDEAPRPDEDSTAVVPSSENPATLIDRAVEVHDSVSAQLSEMYANALIIQEEFDDVAKAGPADKVRIMKAAIEALVAATEEAKGILRGLKELIEFGHDS